MGNLKTDYGLEISLEHVDYGRHILTVFSGESEISFSVNFSRRDIDMLIELLAEYKQRNGEWKRNQF